MSRRSPRMPDVWPCAGVGVVGDDGAKPTNRTPHGRTWKRGVNDGVLPRRGLGPLEWRGPNRSFDKSRTRRRNSLTECGNEQENPLGHGWHWSPTAVVRTPLPQLYEDGECRSSHTICARAWLAGTQSAYSLPWHDIRAARSWIRRIRNWQKVVRSCKVSCLMPAGNSR